MAGKNGIATALTPAQIDALPISAETKAALKTKSLDEVFGTAPIAPEPPVDMLTDADILPPVPVVQPSPLASMPGPTAAPLADPFVAGAPPPPPPPAPAGKEWALVDGVRVLVPAASTVPLTEPPGGPPVPAGTDGLELDRKMGLAPPDAPPPAPAGFEWARAGGDWDLVRSAPAGKPAAAPPPAAPAAPPAAPPRAEPANPLSALPLGASERAALEADAAEAGARGAMESASTGAELDKRIGMVDEVLKPPNDKGELIDELGQKQQAMRDEYAAESHRLLTESRQIADASVDPDRIFKGENAGNIVLAIGSILMSAVSGILGKTAPVDVLSMISKAVDRDVAAQREGIERKRASIDDQRSLLAQYRANLGDMDAAVAATKAHQIDTALARYETMLERPGLEQKRAIFKERFAPLLESAASTQRTKAAAGVESGLRAGAAAQAEKDRERRFELSKIGAQSAGKVQEIKAQGKVDLTKEGFKAIEDRATKLTESMGVAVTGQPDGRGGAVYSFMGDDGKPVYMTGNGVSGTPKKGQAMLYVRPSSLIGEDGPVGGGKGVPVSVPDNLAKDTLGMITGYQETIRQLKALKGIYNKHADGTPWTMVDKDRANSMYMGITAERTKDYLGAFANGTQMSEIGAPITGLKDPGSITPYMLGTASKAVDSAISAAEASINTRLAGITGAPVFGAAPRTQAAK